MLRLAPIAFDKISPWFVDYQKKSKNFEMPPEHAELLGIFKGDDLIGYFIYILYKDRDINTLEINQGYLRADARHKNLSKISMELLEKRAKEAGIHKVILGTNRAVGSYIQFMRSMNYHVERCVFGKRI